MGDKNAWPPKEPARVRRKNGLTVGFIRKLIEGVDDSVKVMVMVREPHGVSYLYGGEPKYDEVGANLQWKRHIKRSDAPPTPEDVRELTLWVYKGKRN